MAGFYFNLTPKHDSRPFFGEIFAIACAMHVNENYCVYFKYEKELTQRQVEYFFSTTFGGRFIADAKKLNSKEQRPINNSHEIAFNGLSRFDFSGVFMKNFSKIYQKYINRFLRIRLENTVLSSPGKNKAAFLCIRNVNTETNKNITHVEFNKICAALTARGIRAIVLIGDALPYDINITESTVLHQMSFIGFIKYGQCLLADTMLPSETQLLAQVYFLKRLKEQYGVNLAIGCPSGGAHMLGSLGIPVVFGDLNGSECSRFKDISYFKENEPLSLRNKSTFFPFKYPIPDNNEEFIAQLDSAMAFPTP